MKDLESVTHNSGRILWKAADNQCLQTPFILYYFLICSAFLGVSQKVNILSQSRPFICQVQNETESLGFLKHLSQKANTPSQQLWPRGCHWVCHTCERLPVRPSCWGF